MKGKDLRLSGRRVVFIARLAGSEDWIELDAASLDDVALSNYR